MHCVVSKASKTADKRTMLVKFGWRTCTDATPAALLSTSQKKGAVHLRIIDSSTMQLMKNMYPRFCDADLDQLSQECTSDASAPNNERMAIANLTDTKQPFNGQFHRHFQHGLLSSYQMMVVTTNHEISNKCSMLDYKMLQIMQRSCSEAGLIAEHSC